MSNSFIDSTKQFQLVNSLLRTLDFHGKRITNAAPSQGLQDYIIQQELNDAKEGLQTQIDVLKKPKMVPLLVITDSEANFKLMAVTNQLYIFFDTDDSNVYLAFQNATLFYKVQVNAF